VIELSDLQLASLRITRFIFHVVHHGEPEPVFFDELDIEEFEPFFLDRVKSILNGTAYEFNPQAGVYTTLREISGDKTLFVDHSRQLAVNFHSHGLEDKRIKKGVMILMEVKTLQKNMFAIIKYEHDQVLRYRHDGAGIVLENVTDTFTRSPDSMQKAALIDMTEENPVVMVLDRNVRAGISGFFQGFLNVRRRKSEQEKSKALWDVIKNTTSRHLDELPRDFSKDVQTRTEEFFESNDKFNPDRYFDTVFGSDATDSVRNTYKHYLQKEDLENEQFYIDKEAASVPRKNKIRTAEGVTIYYDQNAASSIQISYGQDGEKDIIVIESKRVREEL
jgi:hypothetical protein